MLSKNIIFDNIIMLYSLFINYTIYGVCLSY